MAPGDAGLALGLALQALHSAGKCCSVKGQLFSPYIGPSFKNAELKILLDQMKLNYQHIDDSKLGSYVAEKISLGATVGTFYGRAEYGPRSLGHRSILGDARNKDTKQKINLNLKKRDWFMPYAPAILVEDALEWTNILPSPYMQIASMVQDIKKTLIPSAVHVDGTARFQAVHRELSPFFYDVIQNFKSITGVPIVLNTSFNRHGIATISSPRSAIHHLLEGTVDILILGNFVISLSDNRIISNDIDQLLIKDEASLLIEFEMNYKNKILEMEGLMNSNGN
jgi:carbamoyltransferase